MDNQIENRRTVMMHEMRCIQVIETLGSRLKKLRNSKHLRQEQVANLIGVNKSAIARSVLMVSRDQENSEIRYMYPIKASLAPEGETIAFSLSTDQGFQWIGKCDRDPSQFEDVDVTLTKKDRAKEYLKLMLMSEDLPSTEIMTRINSFGIADKTIRIAQKELGITAYRKENAWYWHWNNE
ncbi:helix-turn-helix transcriptional regulator [Lactonifactor sp. BIOML-A7]|uniref:helix-turn-helix domain-containing protein n=1 Tax=Lactonifactor sp. BIOML-A7 TaxID=2584660 RepID=UPI001566F20C|nr:helix-turn-helix transcriptional regulator [Lactonifactor sp. BIOML-A7]